MGQDRLTFRRTKARVERKLCERLAPSGPRLN